MLTAGIDLGAKTVKVVLLEDGKVVGRKITLGGLDQRESAEKLLNEALAEAGKSLSDVEKVVSTGAGRKDAPGAHEDVTEVGAAARGINFIYPSVRTVIDIGAEEGRGVKADARGRAMDFVINEKCAAGAGSFIEGMARALELKIEDFGPLSLESTETVPMNAQCAVFAESEVVSLIHSKTAKQDICRAIHDAIASRIISMVRRIGVEQDVALVGGMAKNPGFIAAMKRGLEIENIIVPDEPEYVGALGAAVIAAENAR
jgi:predicted CoA-substrate-specific enzyme activase